MDIFPGEHNLPDLAGERSGLLGSGPIRSHRLTLSALTLVRLSCQGLILRCRKGFLLEILQNFGSSIFFVTATAIWTLCQVARDTVMCSGLLAVFWRRVFENRSTTRFDPLIYVQRLFESWDTYGNAFA